MPVKDKYRQWPMVNWFEPRMLMQTGIKALISSLFGNYADKREMQAALPDNSTNDHEWDTLHKEYAERDEIWIDYLSDTGDGFNSTYSVAATVARPELTIPVEGTTTSLKRGKLLILGGDQIYPTPSVELYDTKFRIPFEAALPEVKADPDRPHMYAIPGNHDWYDGLNNFLKVFCQQRDIGNWLTRQHRSYFALPLPHNYWLWATDIQLNEDIDQPQQDYFMKIGRDKMQQGDKVILCTAEPAWVYQELHKHDQSYNRFNFFIESYITGDKHKCIGKTFTLVAAITGDLHHYSHYSNAGNDSGVHYFTAGGGGAFLHLTHDLPPQLSRITEKDVRLQQTFPTKAESHQLLTGNLAFPVKNYFFSMLLGCTYFLFFWLLQISSYMISRTTYMENITNWSFPNFLKQISKTLVMAPSLTILSVCFIAGFYAFTDTSKGRRTVKLYGLLHGILQWLMVFLLIWLIANLHRNNVKFTPPDWYWQLLFMAEFVVGGAVTGGFLMGFYLYTANLLFGIHMDESSSSLASPHYKNFLRLHITREGLTIYPIGIKKVTTSWEQGETAGKMHFTGEDPAYELIEQPIFIKNKPYT